MESTLQSTTATAWGSAWDSDIYVVDLERLGSAVASDTSATLGQDDLIRVVFERAQALLASGSYEPPRLPELALELLELTRQPEVVPEDIARLLSREPFLTMRLLRVANSALVQPSARRIGNIPEAIVRLGFNETRNVLVAAALEQCVYSGPRKPLLSSLWRASVGAAVGFQLTALVTGRPTEDCFLAGLLHDVGKPILVRIMEGLAAEELPELDAHFDAVVGPVLHMLHASLGAQVARSWKAPQPLVELVAHHHDRLPPKRMRGAVKRLRLANLLYEAWCRSEDSSELPPALAAHQAFERCKLSDNQITTLLRRYPRRLETMLS
jgi:putative nucleotidyltransferase with HDIG domain